MKNPLLPNSDQHPWMSSETWWDQTIQVYRETDSRTLKIVPPLSPYIVITTSSHVYCVLYFGNLLVPRQLSSLLTLWPFTRLYLMDLPYSTLDLPLALAAVHKQEGSSIVGSQIWQWVLDLCLCAVHFSIPWAQLGNERLNCKDDHQFWNSILSLYSAWNPMFKSG